MGTILGWVLGKIKTGRLKIKVSDFKEQYFYHNRKNGVSGEDTAGELNCIRCEFKIMAYNSSDVSRALRCLQLVFLGNKGEIICAENVMDERTKQSHPYGTTADDIRIVNVEGHTSADISAFVFVSEYKRIHDIKKIMLFYQTENFKKRKEFIKKTDYSHVNTSKEVKE